MGYVTQSQKDVAAGAVAELAELASAKDVAVTAACLASICGALEINRGTILAGLSAELIGHPDFYGFVHPTHFR